MSEGRVYGRNPVLELLRQGGRRTDEIAVLAAEEVPDGLLTRWRAVRPEPPEP